MTRTAAIALSLALAVGSTAVGAQQMRYVSDELVINLRTGQGNQFQILRMLPSGTPLELLEETENGYAHVRTRDGRDGWVLSQYLVNEPVAKDRLARTEQRLAELENQTRALREERAQLTRSSADLEQERKKLAAESERLARELERLKEVAARPVELQQENERLMTRAVTLEKDMQLLQQENHALVERAEREWFLAGAGVLFGGIILGLLLPHLRNRKRANWDKF